MVKVTVGGDRVVFFSHLRRSRMNAKSSARKFFLVVPFLVLLFSVLFISVYYMEV